MSRLPLANELRSLGLTQRPITKCVCPSNFVDSQFFSQSHIFIVKSSEELMMYGSVGCTARFLMKSECASKARTFSIVL